DTLDRRRRAHGEDIVSRLRLTIDTPTAYEQSSSTDSPFRITKGMHDIGLDRFVREMNHGVARWHSHTPNAEASPALRMPGPRPHSPRWHSSEIVVRTSTWSSSENS